MKGKKRAVRQLPVFYSLKIKFVNHMDESYIWLRQLPKMKTTRLVLLTILLLCSGHTCMAQVGTPRPVAFKPLNPDGTKAAPATQSPQLQTLPNASPTRMTAHDLTQQMNARGMQTHGIALPPSPAAPAYDNQPLSKTQRQIDEINKILNEELPAVYRTDDKRMTLTRHYRKAFSELMDMQSGRQPFSLKRAVFLIENAWHEDTLSFDSYSKKIKIKVDAIKMLMNEEGIAENNNLGKNYIIQKLFSERIVEYKNNVAYRVHKPFVYDFEDFTGINDWSKMFVSKLLNTGTGQCHSLPLLYLILAEETNTQAWLSLAPEHSFIVFSDNTGRVRYNYETTNGNVVSDNWLMESGYITTAAIQNGIYLDTLDRNGLSATLIADLVMGYTGKFGYDNFVVTMVESLLAIHPRSIQGQMFKADILMLKTDLSLKKAGNPPLEQIAQHPEAQENYVTLLHQYDLIDRLGYVQMPKGIYETWLASLNSEQHKQEKQKLKTQVITHAKSGN